MLRTTAVLLFTLACSAVAAEGLSDKKLQEIAGIDYRGLDFSSNQSDLLQTIPNAKLNKDHPGSDNGVLTYEVRDDPAIDCVLLRFFDDALVEIKYFYFPTTVASMGGAQPLISLATKKYGSPSKRTNKKLYWDYPTIDRMIAVSSENGLWSMSLFHRLRRLGIPSYKDASAVPQESRIHLSVGPAVPAGYVSRRTKSMPTHSRYVSRSVIKPIEMVAITRNARNDHPGDYSTQEYVIGNQVKAYQELKNLICPRDMAVHEFANLKDAVAKDHPADYSTQVYVLKNQLQSYTQLTATDTPSGIPARATTAINATITVPRSTRETIRRNAKQDAKATNAPNRANPTTEIGVGTMPIVLVVAGLSLLVIYFFPSIIASSRGHKNREPIIAVNIFLGWTFIGWVIAFVWALTHQEPAGSPDM